MKVRRPKTRERSADDDADAACRAPAAAAAVAATRRDHMAVVAECRYVVPRNALKTSSVKRVQ